MATITTYATTNSPKGYGLRAHEWSATVTTSNNNDVIQTLTLKQGDEVVDLYVDWVGTADLDFTVGDGADADRFITTVQADNDGVARLNNRAGVLFRALTDTLLLITCANATMTAKAMRLVAIVRENRNALS